MVVTSGVLGLRAGLGIVAGQWGLWALRAGRGSCCSDEGSLHLVLLIMFLIGSLMWTTFVVFLRLL